MLIVLGCLTVAALSLSHLACGGDDSASGPAANSGAPSNDAASDTASPLDAGADSSDAAVSDTATLNTVTFQYKPQWSGATAVSVLGGFGTSTDWMSAQPFLTLTSDGMGGFSATAQLPDGQYPYVFQVTGDVAAAKPTTYARYVIDPTNPSYVACPAASPTYDKTNPNPCSQLTVPQSAPATLFHLTGTVNYQGAPKAGYLVLLEREEKGSHHFAANRTDSAADGTFDLVMAKGQYRVQVQYPNFISATDDQRDPVTLQAMRRSISSAVPITGPTSFDPVDVSYDSYAALAPTDGGATLPTTFQYTVLSDAMGAHVAVYGPGKDVGDPWYTTPFSKADSGTTLTDTFDGGFNTPQAMQTQVEAGTAYWWGTFQLSGSTDGGVQWQGQSMVFPVTFQ
jgi:hypothetical protein